MDALRATLNEYGHVIPQGIRHVGRIRAILEAPNSDLPALMREECLAMLEQLAVLNGWIDAKTARITELAAATPVRSEEHTSELQSLMRISYAVFCLKKNKHT